MTRDQAEAKVELYAQHRFDLDAYECIECGRWHLQSHWTK